MSNFDDAFVILRTASRKDGNQSVSSEGSCDPPSRKLSIFDFRSRRASASPPACPHRDSVPMAPPQASSVYFTPGDSLIPDHCQDETTSNRSRRSRLSKASIRSSSSATNTNANLPPKVSHKISKKEHKDPPAVNKKPANGGPQTIQRATRPKSTRAARLPASLPPTNPAASPAPLEIAKPAKSTKRGKAPAQKTRCTCRKTKCLKLYCECFATTGFCGPKCRCDDCHNKESLNELRQLIIQETVGKNPLAFKSKFKKVEEKNIKKLHSRGCNCRKTGCVKNYCECFHAGIGCSPLCKCEGCKNEQLKVELNEVTAYRDKVLRKRKRRNYLYDFYFAKCKALGQ